MKRLLKLVEKKERIVMGLMSGTSLDGVDLALVRLSGSGFDLKVDMLDFLDYPMPDHWRKRIQRAFNANTEELCRINFDLGFFFGELILQFFKDTKANISDLDLIGFHGQTLYHIPGHSTMQSGESDIIAKITKTPVVSDFRTADIAVGGEGAPLVPYFDRLLFKDDQRNLALLNIGGMSNLTFLPKDFHAPVVAFDTGPGNAILNEMTEIVSMNVMSYDEDSRLALTGRLEPKVLEDLLQHSYLRQKPPKTTGRETFGKQFVAELIDRYPSVDKIDLLRTLVSFVAETIARGIKNHLIMPDLVLVSGGGAHNPLLMQELGRLLGIEKLRKLEDVSKISVDAKEAVAFAVLAHERLNSKATNIPTATGATLKTCLGKLTLP